jgi:hypothetical protein
MEMDQQNNSTLRASETGTTHVRSDRFFEQQNYWYFRTREGLDIGPFDNLAYAEEGFNGFIGFLQQAHADAVTRITQYMKSQPRKQENNPIPARSHRLFTQNNYWYFRTREGFDIGPFDDRGEAAIGAKGFISFLEESQVDVVTRVTDYISDAA